MSRETQKPMGAVGRPRAWLGLVLGLAAAWLGACAGGQIGDLSPGQQPQEPPPTLGTGKVRVGLILPLSASGNAGLAAQSMKNAAEMALAEFKNPDIQLLLKDSAGTAPGARSAAEQAVNEGAELILGPLFAHSVAAAGQVARSRGIPVIAFSTDTSVAARGVYLLSFLPQSDVDRIVDYAAGHRKRSIAALVPDNAYGSVVEAAFKQAAAGHRARVVALERYPANRTDIQRSVQRVAQAAPQTDALLLPDSGEAVVAIVGALSASGVDVKRLQLLGTGVWDADQQIFGTPALQGAWFAAPDSAGYRGFAARYQRRFGQDPIRTATLAYDGVALVAALAKTQGAQRFSEAVLTNSSGFTGVDGVFRFRPDGTNQRGLAVLRVTSGGAQVISPAPRSFEVGP